MTETPRKCKRNRPKFPAIEQIFNALSRPQTIREYGNHQPTNRVHRCSQCHPGV